MFDRVDQSVHYPKEINHNYHNAPSDQAIKEGRELVRKAHETAVRDFKLAIGDVEIPCVWVDCPEDNKASLVVRIDGKPTSIDFWLMDAIQCRSPEELSKLIRHRTADLIAAMLIVGGFRGRTPEIFRRSMPESFRDAGEACKPCCVQEQ